MKHLQNLVEEEEATIDMTPMLDVVFIMLIFFIVTASFVKESGIDVNRPDAPTAVKKDRANILIGISDKNAKLMCAQYKLTLSVCMLKTHKGRWLFRRIASLRLSS